jgi:acyl carrier protein
MGQSFSEKRRRDLREKLVAMIETSDLEPNGSLADDTSLIKSGHLDSLGLFNVALFIEREIGYQLDITSFDLTAEWDTVQAILDFIQKLAT